MPNLIQELNFFRSKVVQCRECNQYYNTPLDIRTIIEYGKCFDCYVDTLPCDCVGCVSDLEFIK